MCLDDFGDLPIASDGCQVSLEDGRILLSIPNTTEESRLRSTHGMYIREQVLLDLVDWYGRIRSVGQFHGGVVRGALCETDRLSATS